MPISKKINHNNPKIYLITPSEFELRIFSETLKRILDNHEVACIRLEQSSRDELLIGKSADTLREICHKRDIPIIIDSHFMLVEKFGLDGVHLKDGSKSVRTARKVLGKDLILELTVFNLNIMELMLQKLARIMLVLALCLEIWEMVNMPTLTCSHGGVK